jgi:hypothetical protein
VDEAVGGGRGEGEGETDFIGAGISLEGSSMWVLVFVEPISSFWRDEGVLVTEPSGERLIVSPSMSSRSRIDSALPISSP